MNDDRLERSLSEAIAGLAGTSTPAYLDDILKRTARTRQRPWWGFPRRYVSMSSTLRFAAVAAIALAVGAAVVPSGPRGPEVIAPAAQMDRAPLPPTEFSGTVSCGDAVAADRWGSGEILQIGDETTLVASFADTYLPPFQSAEPTDDEATLLARFRDGAWHHQASMSDPRLEGAWYRTHEYDAYRTAGSESGPALIVNTLRIENDEGAWTGSSIIAELAAGPSTQLAGDTPMVLVGEGAYEGLTAVLTTLPSAVQGCTVVTEGVIFDTSPAPVPYLPPGA
jgi:hypothetical protein